MTANVRIEWVLLEPESTAVTEVLGAIEEFIDGHHKFDKPDNFRPRRNGNRLAVRVVQATGNIYMKSSRPDEPDVSATNGLKYLGGFEAHKIREGVDATYMLVEPGEQLFVFSEPSI